MRLRLFYGFMLCALSATAQSDLHLRHPEPIDKDAPSSNVVFVEAGGAAYLYSANYAHIFRQQGVSSMMRIGLSVTPALDQGVYVPAEYSLLFGGEKSYVEFGIAACYFSREVSNYYTEGGAFIGYTGEQFRTQGINISGRIGYCFLPLRKKALMVRLAWTPIHFARSYYFDEVNPLMKNLPGWGGVSVGYAF